MPNGLYTNSTGKDTIRNAFYEYASRPCEVLLASPFFSNHELVTDLVKRGCDVRLVVRLGAATSARSLARVLMLKGVQVRYFTSPHFHPKLYIFGQHAALVGSANLTDRGTTSNREISVTVDAEDERFVELVKVYQRYWTEAHVLTPERSRLYSQLQAGNERAILDPFETEVLKRFGDFGPKGLLLGQKSPPKESVFIESYLRVYQEFLDAFGVVQGRYKELGKRMQPESAVPMRIEIDQFFSFIRERLAKGDSYKAAPIRSGLDLDAHIDATLKEWHSQRWQYLDTKIPPHFARINEAFGAAEPIQSMSAEQIFDALRVCHSINDRFRYFLGGHPAWKKRFIEVNEIGQLRRVISFLLHGDGNYVERMASCIYDDTFALNEFGKSAVQELFGWVNQEGVPICNGRTVKALRYLGFNVAVFN